MFSPATIAATVSEFVGILEPEVGAIANMAGAKQDLVTQVTAGLDGLKTSAAALASAESTTAAAPIAQRIVADGEAVLNALSALPLGGSVVMVVRIAQMVFAVLPGIVALLFPAKPAAPPAAA